MKARWGWILLIVLWVLFPSSAQSEEEFDFLPGFKPGHSVYEETGKKEGGVPAGTGNAPAPKPPPAESQPSSLLSWPPSTMEDTQTWMDHVDSIKPDSPPLGDTSVGRKPLPSESGGGGEFIHIDPITVDPIQIDPIQVDPVKVDPIQIDPIQIDPIQVEPIEVEPIQFEPIFPSGSGFGYTSSYPTPPPGWEWCLIGTSGCRPLSEVISIDSDGPAPPEPTPPHPAPTPPHDGGSPNPVPGMDPNAPVPSPVPAAPEPEAPSGPWSFLPEYQPGESVYEGVNETGPLPDTPETPSPEPGSWTFLPEYQPGESVYEGVNEADSTFATEDASVVGPELGWSWDPWFTTAFIPASTSGEVGFWNFAPNFHPGEGLWDGAAGAEHEIGFDKRAPLQFDGLLGKWTRSSPGSQAGLSDLFPAGSLGTGSAGMGESISSDAD